MASVTLYDDVGLSHPLAAGERRDAGITATSTLPPTQPLSLSATTTSYSTNKRPEDATLERQRVDHKLFRSKRRREREETGDLESGLWHATARLQIRSNRNRANTSCSWPYALLLLFLLTLIVLLSVLFYTDHLRSRMETGRGQLGPGDAGTDEEGFHSSLKPGCGVIGWIAGCPREQHTRS